ncbi:MAG: GNAT family N-acetyltransferase [Alteromonadaceae bacterium]|nr:MAG: GNAT family N-acetyltransferase [Alteromonadaceae bacterium]
MNIRKADIEDIDNISVIYSACFPKEQDHKLWIEASFNSFPRGVYYVIEHEGVISGYILWCVKNGFRKSTIIELEQIGVSPRCSGKGLGRKLIDQSFNLFKEHVVNLGYKVGAVMVTTSEGNYAENLYKSTLNVTRAATLTGYGSGNEIILYKHSI